VRARADGGYANLDQPGSFHFHQSKIALFLLAQSLLLALMLAGCAGQNVNPAPAPAANYYAPPPTNYRGGRTEVASWYGPGFVGRRTSSGEIYNPEGLTAASKTLPLGSHVRVTNPDTGRSVVVRINDRGPYVRGRSLDLSHGAAKQIGLTGKGVGRVQVTSAASPPPESSTAVYAYSLAAAGPSNYSGSYLPQLASSRPRSHHYRHSSYRRSSYRSSSYRRSSSRRTVSNPIGSWLSSAFPRF
jgi:rare lipoprotein A (peptidoglycan hydrolase)